MSGPTITGEFLKGYRFKPKDGEEQWLKDFELRLLSTEDMLAAEDDCPSSKPLQFNLACAARQLVRIGHLKGPFTLGMLRRGLPDLRDYNALREKQLEVQQLGE